MSSQGSVTRLVDQLRPDDPAVRDDAARRVWERYVPALLDLARHHPDRKLGTDLAAGGRHERGTG